MCGFVSSKLNLEQFGSKMFELRVNKVVVGIVVDFTDINELKVMEEILPDNEEDSIFICFSGCVLIL